MKNYIRKFLFTLGLKTTTTIVSSFAKIAEELEAITAHHLNAVAGNQQAITSLAAANDALLDEVRKASNAAANVRAILG